MTTLYIQWIQKEPWPPSTFTDFRKIHGATIYVHWIQKQSRMATLQSVDSYTVLGHELLTNPLYVEIGHELCMNPLNVESGHELCMNPLNVEKG